MVLQYIFCETKETLKLFFSQSKNFIPSSAISVYNSSDGLNEFLFSDWSIFIHTCSTSPSQTSLVSRGPRVTDLSDCLSILGIIGPVGYSNFFSPYVGSSRASTVHPPKMSGISSILKNIWNFSKPFFLSYWLRSNLSITPGECIFWNFDKIKNKKKTHQKTTTEKQQQKHKILQKCPPFCTFP